MAVRHLKVVHELGLERRGNSSVYLPWALEKIERLLSWYEDRVNAPH